MQPLRQSTQIVVKIGPFLDATDGVSEETGLAGGGTELSKSPGAAFGAGPTLGTHDAEGWYPITLTTTHTDTVGRLVVKSHNSGTHLPVWHEFYVYEEAVFDQLYAASAPGAATPASISALNNLSAAQVNAEVDTALADYDAPTKAELDAGFAALNDLSAAEVNAEVDAALNTAVPATPTAGSINERIKTMDDADIPGAIAGLNDLSAAAVNAEVDTALADYDAPTRAELTSDVNSILDKLLGYVQLLARSDAAIATDRSTELGEINANEGSGAGDYASTTDSQEAIADSGGGGPTAAQIADAVWDEALAGHLSAGSTGEALNAAGGAGDPWITALPGSYTSGQAGFILGTFLDVAVSGRSSHSAADVWAVATRLLTAGTNIVLAKGVGVTGFNDLSAAAVNAEVDTALADYDGPTRAEATSDKNEILTILGTPADTDLATDIAARAAPTYDIELGAAYSGTTLTVIGVPKKDGAIQTGLGTMTFKVWSAAGAQVGSTLTDASADAQGAYSASGTYTLSDNTQYYLEASITIDAATRTVRRAMTKVA